jgi:hypothetical protein
MNILFCPFLTTCSVGAGGGGEEAYAKLPHPCRYKSSNFKDCTHTKPAVFENQENTNKQEIQ